MKIKTLIIDDEPIALEKLRNYTEKVPFLQLEGVASDGVEAMKILSSTDIDLIFTDINMPDLNGMEMIQALPAPPLVVFITAYSDYAVESYRLSAVDYLLKPYSFSDFQRAANKALQRISLKAASAPGEKDHKHSGSLFIKIDYRHVRVDMRSIKYIKGYGEYLQIFTDSESTPLVTLSSFNAIKERLTDNFIQVHRSYIVNMDKIKEVVRGRVIIDNDTYIPVGDSYRLSLQNYLK